MSHHTVKSSYRDLVLRLNRFPQGAPPSDLLYKILQLLFSETEARLVALLPILPFKVETAAGIWKLKEEEARKILDELAGKGLLLDLRDPDGNLRYLLPPPMAGFFEFSMMRVRGDIDQKMLGTLFYRYINVEEDFVKALFLKDGTSFGRVFVHEPALPPETALRILDYEKASEVIRTASVISVGLCYCRHKMSHVGRDCKAPKEICMTFGFVADSLIRHDFGRRVGAAEGLDLLNQAQEMNLVQCGENVRRKVSFLCHCCGCCCEGLIAARKFGYLHPVHTTRFIPRIGPACCGCGKCRDACPIGAINLVPSHNPHRPGEMRAELDETVCLGCGVCVRNCPIGAMRLEERAERVITPVDSVRRTVTMAVERGLLQNLIFDNQALLSHRGMAAILGVILRLPPVKRALANRQLQSRYLDFILSRRPDLLEWQ